MSLKYTADMNQWLLVAIGGAAGSLLRFAIAGALNPPRPGANAQQWSTFPTGTLAVNLIGCALIGLIAGWLEGGAIPAGSPASAWRPLLLVGVLGGFTTFSTFGIETVLMLRSGFIMPALAYVAASTALGITLAAAGYSLAARN